MKISCLQENLSRGLAVVGRAVATRATLPVTQNVLLSVDQSMLKLSATNLEIAMTTACPDGATIRTCGRNYRHTTRWAEDEDTVFTRESQ